MSRMLRLVVAGCGSSINDELESGCTTDVVDDDVLRAFRPRMRRQEEMETEGMSIDKLKKGEDTFYRRLTLPKSESLRAETDSPKEWKHLIGFRRRNVAKETPCDTPRT